MGGGVFLGKEGEGEAVLVEGHPEEDDYGEHEAEGHDAVLGVLLAKLGFRLGIGVLAGSGLGGRCCNDLLEGALETIVDAY